MNKKRMESARGALSIATKRQRQRRQTEPQRGRRQQRAVNAPPALPPLRRHQWPARRTVAQLLGTGFSQKKDERGARELLFPSRLGACGGGVWQRVCSVKQSGCPARRVRRVRRVRVGEGRWGVGGVGRVGRTASSMAMKIAAHSSRDSPSKSALEGRSINSSSDPGAGGTSLLSKECSRGPLMARASPSGCISRALGGGGGAPPPMAISSMADAPVISRGVWLSQASPMPSGGVGSSGRLASGP